MLGNGEWGHPFFSLTVILFSQVVLLAGLLIPKLTMTGRQLCPRVHGWGGGWGGRSWSKGVPDISDCLSYLPRVHTEQCRRGGLASLEDATITGAQQTPT